MAIETRLQGLLHNLDQGTLAVWLWRTAVAAVMTVVAMIFFVFKFNGFSVPEAMDQAQIGRQIATGQGFTTLYARPLAMHLGLARTGRLNLPLSETSQAPLGPMVNAAVLLAGRTNFKFGPEAYVSPADRVIVLGTLVFFAGSMVLTYILGCRLFDPRLSLLGVGIVIATDLVWRFAFSGLPQMVMLFFFTASLLALVAGLDANASGRRAKAVVMTLLAALSLGIVTLGNGLGLWIFAGFWLFAIVTIKPRLTIAIASIVAYSAPLLPWAWHNWIAMRNPFGLPYYELFRKPGTDSLAFLSDFEPFLHFDFSDVLVNTADNFMSQAAGLFSYLGGSVVAAAFFVALALHIFRSWRPAQFRWAVLFMWSGAAAGMSVFGVGAAVSVNQMHILFYPVMVLYGLAVLLMLWTTVSTNQPLLRTLFLVFLYIVTLVPLAGTLAATAPRVNWPPYLPPLITRLAEWVRPDEAIASDIPWATAWYGNRLSLLLPESIGQFEIIHSERILGMPMVGIYLTPFSRDLAAYDDIINGRYREWARFVLGEIRPEEISSWMLRSAISLPVDNQCIFYADRPRWR